MPSSLGVVALRGTLAAVLLLSVTAATDAHAQDVQNEIRAEVERSVATVNSADPQALADSGPRAPIRRTSSCVVSRIVDGDTFECRGVGRVRLIGMDTPEVSQEPYGALATEALMELTPVGSTVQLEPDVERRDRYGRTLAYVWANGLMVNWALVRQGWAVVLTYPPNVQYVEWFTEAQRRAREEGLGLWSVSGFDCAPIDRRRGRCE